MDDLLDRLQVEFIAADLREPRRAAGLDLQVAVQLALVARFYERIGDHAVNIGERVALHGDRLAAGPRRAGAAALADEHAELRTPPAPA